MSRIIVFFLTLSSFVPINIFFNWNTNKFKEGVHKIEWCGINKLTWRDFKGLKNDSINQFIVARTSGEIKVENGVIINGIPKFDIKCYFIKDKSWTIVDDNETLVHEQLHFDIFEIYTRKIRKAYKILNNKKIKELEIYQNEYDKFINECDKYNDIYDNQVYFNDEKQMQWSIKIAKELEELKAYEIKCICKK